MKLLGPAHPFHEVLNAPTVSLSRLISGLENIGLAGVELALNALDDPVSFRGDMKGASVAPILQCDNVRLASGERVGGFSDVAKCRTPSQEFSRRWIRELNRLNKNRPFSEKSHHKTPSHLVSEYQQPMGYFLPFQGDRV